MAVVGRLLRRFLKNQQHSEDLEFFRNVTLFYGLTSHQLGRIFHAMQKRRYHVGERLFQEGQIGKAVFIVRSGQVELTRETNDGKNRVLGKLGPGQIFGEMALLEQLPRTASATVIEDGDIYLLYTAALESLIQHHPQIGVKLLRNMSVMLSALLRRTNHMIDTKGAAA